MKIAKQGKEYQTVGKLKREGEDFNGEGIKKF